MTLSYREWNLTAKSGKFKASIFNLSVMLTIPSGRSHEPVPTKSPENQCLTRADAEVVLQKWIDVKVSRKYEKEHELFDENFRLFSEGQNSVNGGRMVCLSSPYSLY